MEARVRLQIFRAVLAGFGMLLIAAAAMAQLEVKGTLDQVDRDIEALSNDLRTVEDSLLNADPDGVDLEEVRTELAGFERRAGEIFAMLSPVRDQVVSALATLGPLEEGVEEPEEIASERTRLTAQQTRVDGLVRRLEVAGNRILALRTRLAEISRDRFLVNVFQRGPSPLSLTVWQEVLSNLERGRGAAMEHLADWYEGLQGPGHMAIVLGSLAVGILILLVLAFPVRRKVSIHIGLHTMGDAPGSGRLCGIAFIRLANRMVWVVLGFAIFAGIAAFHGVPGDTARPLVMALAIGLFAVYIGDGLAKTIFAPGEPELRPLKVTDRQAQVLSLSVTGMTSIFAIDVLTQSIGDYLDAGLSFAVAEGFIISVGAAIVLLPLAYPPLWLSPPATRDPGDQPDAPGGPEAAAESDPQDETEEQKAGIRTILFIPMMAILALVPLACALAGYASLSRFLIEKAVYIGGLLGVLYLLRGFLKTIILNWVHRLQPSRTASPEPEEEPVQESFLDFWVGLTLDSTLLVLALPLALLIMGMVWADIWTLALLALQGVKIGPVTLSPAALFLGVLLFVGGLLFTRLIQRILATRLLPKTNLNSGARDSLRTLVGYSGFAITFMAAIGFIGVDLSNIALIAGALSVGIGFGLQGIVNNFVSGLILLFERPFKVGDWIVTTSGEGIVRRISVRSTEIESFTRQSIIIPNAEMISSAVSNWTHRDKIARVTIAVGVAYGSPVREVERILLECAQEEPRLTRRPAAYVYFAGFGDSSLDLELRAFVRNNDEVLGIQTGLRFAVVEKFEKAGITIPFPQRDVHIITSPGKDDITAPASDDGSRGTKPGGTKPGGGTKSLARPVVHRLRRMKATPMPRPL